MRIKRLDITGFKSFMDRVVFSFDDGMTGVVGPNGCGKSNVVDAIRWAMGEQSAKNLRGRGMEDVIFNGSETHAPLSMAEVTLTFAVSETDVLPETLAGMPEVSVTRRLFRSGESNYLINKTTCRLLDITELFLGTGVGTRAYSIIEQGRVGQIVSARPEDRRSFIEEAAGITKYKARRKVAERKMEYTQQNLLRVNDIVAELERRLESVERQARKAEKYKKLKGEMRGLELHAAAQRWLELTATRRVIQNALSELSLQEKETHEQVGLKEAQIAEQRTVLEALAATADQRSAEVHGFQSQVQLDAQNVRHWNDDLAATNARISAAELELQQVIERRNATESDRASAASEFANMGVSSKEDEVTLQVREEELRRAIALDGEIAFRLETDRRALVEMATAIANHEAALKGLIDRKAELAQKSVKLNDELASLSLEEAQLDATRREVLDRVEQHRQMTRELTQRRGEEEMTLEKARESFAESEVMVIALREELQDKRSRLNSLEEIQQNYEGYDRGVRSVMAKAGPDPRQVGVFGLVSDLVSAPPEFERAVEAALGERLQHVLVENVDRGFEFVEYLRGLAEGRSTFYPVPSEQVEPMPALVGDGIVGMALSHISVADEMLRPAVAQLLSGVALVSDLAAARKNASKHKAYTFVTLDGEVVRPHGVVTGGVMEGAAVGTLQKRREIGELQTEVSRVEERYNEMITRHYELQKQVGQSESLLKGLDKNHHAEELSLNSHEKDLHQTGTNLSRLRERIENVRSEIGRNQDLQKTVEFDLESARGEAAHGQTDKELRDDRVRLMTTELEALRLKTETLQSETMELKIKVASISERSEASRLRSEALAVQVGELDARAARLTQARDEAKAHVQALEARIVETQSEREERGARSQLAQAELEQSKVAYTEAAAQVRDVENALRELRSRFDSLTQDLSVNTLKAKELALELEHLERSTQERHLVQMAEAVSQFHTEATLNADDEEKLKELRAALERMGEVNVTAIEEHQEIQGRFEFLSKQKKDLEDSLGQLEDAIRKIDDTSRVRFKETFDVVNEKFEQVFPRLFGGGRASLMLVQVGAGEEPGVEILAQPPGKKLQSVNLFSGGEKALTAVALIFAIFLIKPTPFCLLDEVDAPLDEGNVGRYNEIVKEMSKTSQFIVITHNKRTMEVVDTLYGVTMEEPGISKLVAVKLKSAVAANSDQNVA